MSAARERVTHIVDPTSASHIPLFLPRVSASRARGGGGKGGADGGPREDVRPLRSPDVDRVLDFPNMPDPPPPCHAMHCEAPGSGIDDDADGGGGGMDDAYDGGVAFPKRSIKLAGGYVFLSRVKKEGSGERANPQQGGKVACIPLRGCEVEFPPGGRRVFREHAHTGARRGYEMAIRVKRGPGEEKVTCYIVLDSLGSREAWSRAIRSRHDVGNKPTVLRPGGIAGSRLQDADDALYGDGGGTRGRGGVAPFPSASSRAAGPGHGPSHRAGRSQKSLLRSSVAGPSSRSATGAAEAGGNPDLDAAVERFGSSNFREDAWVHDFLAKHPADDLAGECDRLDKWTVAIKDGLRGAVLEQYEYFVEASREMSTMGREVAWIRSLVERQQETLMGLRNIDFGGGGDDGDDDEGGGGGGDEEYGFLGEGGGGTDDDRSDASSVASSSSDEDPAQAGQGPSASRTPMRTNVRTRRRESSARGGRGRGGTTGGAPNPAEETKDMEAGGGGDGPSAEIPPYLTDVAEEVAAFVKESRYSDAADLILKAKAEVADLLATYDRPTPPVVGGPGDGPGGGIGGGVGGGPPGSGPQRRLPKRQLALLRRIGPRLDALLDRMAKRLAENLRRKNEALRASAKRERADPLSNLAPLVSPTCLNDDAVALHLLVRLGRYQEAATAYAARRSLLLSECLHERPISSPVGMDAVIYAAQISSGFFSSLSAAIEGFLDLFVDSGSDHGGTNDDDTSLNSRSLTLGGGEKRVPPGALSAVVLWCDSELAKFANVFGSSRLLGSLALSPPGIRRQETKEGDRRVSLAKEREHSIEVAAKCISQAFAFASENLDTIGLPLTPKLAENMRPKLKGCEAEVAALLDSRWKALAFEWSMDRDVGDIHVPSRPMASSRPLADDRRV